MKNWKCPECGEINSGGMTLCVCGYRDDQDGQKEDAPVSPPLGTNQVLLHRPMEREAKRQFRGIGSSSHRLGFTENWFRLARWKDAYVRWVVIALFCIFIYRNTTDGLLFIAFLALSVAYRLEAHKKYGTPIIAGKKKGQSIREFGLWRTVVAIVWPSCETADQVDGVRIVRGFFITTIALHMYVGVIAIFDCINSQFASQVFIVLNKSIVSLLMHWPSFNKTIVDLITNGYGYRIHIVTHVFAVTVIGSVILGVYWFKIFLKSNFVKDFYHAKNKRLKVPITSCKNSLYNLIIEKVLINPFGIWIIILIILIIFNFLLFYAVGCSIYYFGDPHPRHGKYIWLYSYIYKDNSGLFTIVYTILILISTVYACIPFILEPLYKFFLYISGIIKK